MLVEYNNDYSDINIMITPRPQDIYRPCDMLEYMYVGAYFNYCATLLDGMMLHGSAISYKDNGIIFTAPCGTGKSTHTTLWKKYFPETKIINDDKPLIRFADNKPWVCGTPFCGKAYINENYCAPLKAIVYLQQSPHNSMEQLSIPKALGYLYEQALKSIVDERIIDKTLKGIERLLYSTPCYLLKCTPDENAVKCVQDTLRQDGLL